MNASVNTSQSTFYSTPRDQAAQAIVPYGRFIQFPKDAVQSKLPARLRKLPVLHGHFNHEFHDFNPALPAYVGYGQTGTLDTNILTFRLQRGPNMLYWLANPADPCVWEALDLWASAKALVRMAEFSNGETMLLSRSFELVPRVRALRADIARGPARTMRFREAAADLIGTGDIRHIATTDIAAYPKLNHVQGCLVSTPLTWPVSIPPANVQGRLEASRFLVEDGSPPKFMSSPK